MDEKTKKKYLLLKVGVIGLTVLILALWILNLKNIWSADRRLATSSEDNQDWADLKVSLDKTIVDIKGQLDDLQKTRSAAKRSSDQALLSDLLKETNKKVSDLASSSSPIATSSATSSEATSSDIIATTTPPNAAKIEACPKYINCMPTIGASRPCQIPAGCEGITQIAY